MKLLFLYLGTALLNVAGSSGFYTIKFESLDGMLIEASSYQGKKVVVAVVSLNTAGVNLVRYLDSVQKASAGSVQVIAIPTNDFSGSVNIQQLRDLKKTLKITVTKPLRVKRNNAYLQHPLFAWLTKATENSHFDMDVEGEGQVFMISAKGTLYSVLPKDTPKAVIGRVINRPFNE